MDRVVAVVTALNYVPYVRYAVFVEVIVVSLGSVESYDVVLSTACYHKEIWLLVRIAPLECARTAGCRADSAYIAELVAVLHAYHEGFHTAH